jgi:hypothetical protein
MGSVGYAIWLRLGGAIAAWTSQNAGCFWRWWERQTLCSIALRASHHERGMIRSCEDEHGRVLCQAQQLRDADDATAEANRSAAVSVLTRDHLGSARDQLAETRMHRCIDARIDTSLCRSRPWTELVSSPDAISLYRRTRSAPRRTVSIKMSRTIQARLCPLSRLKMR